MPIIDIQIFFKLSKHYWLIQINNIMKPYEVCYYLRNLFDK